MKRLAPSLFGVLACAASGVWASDEVKVVMHLISADGIGARIGIVELEDAGRGNRTQGKTGVTIEVHVAGLPPGPHGFHVHEFPDCGPRLRDGVMVAGLAAGGHYDPAGTGMHLGPYGEGHLGDLPVLEVGNDGRANVELNAPRPRLADLRGRALMIHAGGDNYSDSPVPLGGGGARIACGLIY